MKFWKALCMSMAMLTIPQVACAQDFFHPRHWSNEKNEIAVAFGVWPMRPNLAFDRDNDNTDRYSPFEVTGEYFYHPTKNFSIGFNLTYIPVFNDDWDDYDDRSSRRNNAFGRSDDFEESIIIVMPSVRMEWVKLRNFSLYSRLAAGVGLEFDHHADNTNAGFTFQVVPFGVTIGQKVYARLEFPSFGYQGLFNAGIGYRF